MQQTSFLPNLSLWKQSRSVVLTLKLAQIMMSFSKVLLQMENGTAHYWHSPGPNVRENSFGKVKWFVRNFIYFFLGKNFYYYLFFDAPVNFGLLVKCFYLFFVCLFLQFYVNKTSKILFFVKYALLDISNIKTQRTIQ